MFPGALIKFYLQSLGAKGIIERDKGSKARLSCYIGVIRRGQIISPIEAIVEGKVADTFVDGGFGFDPCFIPNLNSETENDDYHGQSYSTLPSYIKNKVSHRAVAFNNLKNLLLETSNVVSRIKGNRRGSKKRNSKKTGGAVNFYDKYLKYKTKYLALKEKDI